MWDVTTGECVATLEGHSDGVRCGVHCTFVLIWLRRRSIVLLSARTGGASCPGRATGRSSSGGCRGPERRVVAKEILLAVLYCLWLGYSRRRASKCPPRRHRRNSG